MALAIHTICRPLSHCKPIPREDCLSLSKLAEEGSLLETAIVLGWQINTRSLSLSLPLDKLNTWRQDVQTIIENKRAAIEELECVLGRLNHAAAAFPLARYFLNRLRKVSAPSSTYNSNHHSKNYKKWLLKCVLEDLQLLHDVFLPKILEGINLNLLTHRRPNHILFSDACPTGLGGYFINTGNAWRWKVRRIPRFSP